MMKTTKALAQFMAAAQERDSYWVEHAKLDMSILLERERQRSGLTYKALAEKLGTSQAYISKVFRGDANLTIETIVKLARSLSCVLELELKSRVQETHSFHVGGQIQQQSMKDVFDAFIKLTEDDTVKYGRFTLTPEMMTPCNDSVLCDAA